MSCESELNDFSVFGHRLRTFNDKHWPPDSPVFIKELVEAGFVYTGEIDLVFCFKCGITESNWQENDDPLRRHNASSPYCPYLLAKKRKSDDSIQDNDAIVEETSSKSLQDNARESSLFIWVPGKGPVKRPINEYSTKNPENVEIIPSESNAVNSIAGQESLQPVINFRLGNEKMRFETERYRSYAMCPPSKHWPSPEKLAAAGFYYVDDKIGMKCFCCDAQVTGWESAEQSPLTKHSSLSPQCLFVRGVFCGNIPSGQEDVSADLLLLIQNTKPNTNKIASEKRYIDPEFIRDNPSPPLSRQVSDVRPPEKQMATNFNDIDANTQNHLESEIRYDSIERNRFGGAANWEPTELPSLNGGFQRALPNGYQREYYDIPCSENSINFLENRQPFSHDMILMQQNHQMQQQAQQYLPSIPRYPMEGTFPYGTSHQYATSNSEFKDESKRMKTFFTWPRNSHISPLELAKSGFIYMGKEDKVRCYMCDVVLCGWSHNGTPWAEHEKSSPECQLVLKHRNNHHIRQPSPVSPPPLLSNESLLNPMSNLRVNNHQNREQPSPCLYQGLGQYNSHINRYRDPRINENASEISREMLGLRRNVVGGSMGHHVNPLGISNGQRIYHPNKMEANRLEGGFHQNRGGGLLEIGKLTEQSGHKISGDCEPYARQPIPISAAETRKKEENNRRVAEKFAKNKIQPNNPEKFCKICMENDIAVTFVPCGHLAVCESCSLGLQMCPICRKGISTSVRTYFYGN